MTRKPIDRAEVRRIADLARLDPDDEELAELTREFADILGYLERLAHVDTDGVEPLAHPLPLTDVLRDDVEEPSLPRADALAGAPATADDGTFLVPRVLDPDR